MVTRPVSIQTHAPGTNTHNVVTARRNSTKGQQPYETSIKTNGAWISNMEATCKQVERMHWQSICRDTISKRRRKEFALKIQIITSGGQMIALHSLIPCTRARMLSESCVVQPTSQIRTGFRTVKLSKHELEPSAQLAEESQNIRFWCS